MAFSQELITDHIETLNVEYIQMVIMQNAPPMESGSEFEEKGEHPSPPEVPVKNNSEETLSLVSLANTAHKTLSSTGMMLGSLANSALALASYSKSRIEHRGEIKKLKTLANLIKTFSHPDESDDWVQFVISLGNEAHTSKCSQDFCEFLHLIRHAILNCLQEHDNHHYLDQQIQELQTKLDRKLIDLKTHIKDHDDQESVNLLEQGVYAIVRELLWLGQFSPLLDLPSTIRKVLPLYKYPLKGFPHCGTYRYFNGEEAQKRDLSPNQPFPMVVTPEFPFYFRKFRLKEAMAMTKDNAPPHYSYLVVQMDYPRNVSPAEPHLPLDPTEDEWDEMEKSPIRSPVTP